MAKLPSVIEYYKQHVETGVDLSSTPKRCCPFHKEDTPSFSYNTQTKRWRCFGACKAGGDVIDLHKLNYKFKTKEEAKRSLSIMYGVNPDKIEMPDVEQYLTVDPSKVNYEIVYQKCLTQANCVDRWIELDRIMSKYPVETVDLELLLKKWESERNGI